MYGHALTRQHIEERVLIGMYAATKSLELEEFITLPRAPPDEERDFGVFDRNAGVLGIIKCVVTPSSLESEGGQVIFALSPSVSISFL